MNKPTLRNNSLMDQLSKPIPKLVKCGTCDGTGRTMDMGYDPCTRCLGSGKDLDSEFHALHCIYCNGKGRIPYCDRRNICSSCNGSRFITIYV